MSEDLTHKLKADIPIQAWLTEPLSPEVAMAVTRLSRAPDVRRIAIMPDVHPGEGFFVGIVLATKRLLYPTAIGADIGCGISAIQLNGDRQSLTRTHTRERALDALRQAVPILRHSSIRSVPEVVIPNHDLSSPHLVAASRRDGQIEFATLGRGNHFLEVQHDEDDRLWLTVHSGSRAMGQIVTGFHLKNAERMPGGMMALDFSTAQGQSYLNDVHWAVKYARQSRERMLRAAAESLQTTLGINAGDTPPMGTTHNHARLEHHDGEPLIVHRKGASPATAGDSIIIPGSMATQTFHATGRGCAAALCSSSHGAGRILSRTEARRRITPDSMLGDAAETTFERRHAQQLVDESPRAYRDIRRVMRAQKDLVRITRTLTPLICLKGV